MRVVEQAAEGTTDRQTPFGSSEADAGFGVVVYGRRDARVRWLRAGDAAVVGRSFPAELVLDDRSLSRQHARIIASAGKISLTDLGSTNGVWLRGKRVSHAELRAGDSVQLGGVTLVVRGAPVGRLVRFDELMSEARARVLEAGDARRPVALALIHDAVAHCARIGELLGADACGAVYGGNTLAVLLPGFGERQASDFVAEVGARLRFTVRAGIAVFPDAASHEQGLLAATREALERSTMRVPIACAGATQLAREGSAADDSAIVAVCENTVNAFGTARRAARSDLPVLVLGETGTGKEVLARAIHRSSPRAGRVFRIVNCGALAPSLMESALFGHEKGSFTGATQAHAGIFEQAHGGTLFLDEVGELSPAAQAALLRVLETKTLCRLGGSDDRKVDVRVVAATHRDLPALAAAGSFREDLVHRLNAVTILLPPLRERRAEVPIFVERFLRSGDLPPDTARKISPEALDLICAYGWPGNVRQLKNVIERAAVLALGDTIEVDDLLEDVRGRTPEPTAMESASVAPSFVASASVPPPSVESASVPPPSVESPLSFRERLQHYEADLLRRALAQCEGNRTRAAQVLRMPLRTFMKRLKEYGIA